MYTEYSKPQITDCLSACLSSFPQSRVWPPNLASTPRSLSYIAATTNQLGMRAHRSSQLVAIPFVRGIYPMNQVWAPLMHSDQPPPDWLPHQSQWLLFEQGYQYIFELDWSWSWRAYPSSFDRQLEVDLHLQNVFSSIGASGSDGELSDQNTRVVKYKSFGDRCSGLQEHLGPPLSANNMFGSSNHMPGSTWQGRPQSWEHVVSL